MRKILGFAVLSFALSAMFIVLAVTRAIGYLPLAGVVPSYGAVYALGTLIVPLATGLIVDGTESSTVVSLCGMLNMCVLTLDLWAASNLFWWVTAYLMGTLPAAAALVTGTVVGHLAAALLMLLVVAMDICISFSYLMLILDINRVLSRSVS